MKKSLSMEFIARQYMTSGRYEIFYYNDRDRKPPRVDRHTHDFYEFYFFLEGDVTYEIGEAQYRLTPGDCLLIPPGLSHRPLFGPTHASYRRYVLWLSQDLYQELRRQSGATYCLDYARDHRIYRFPTEFLFCQELQGRLTDLLLESRSALPFRDFAMNTLLAGLLLQLNRTLYDNLHQKKAVYDNALYLNVCDYINRHLDEELTLDRLAAFFYVSKYHISHIFKDNMGISLHQYILKKRLQACKNAILSGQPANHVCLQWGFADYTAFYRAFKKEYGCSPKTYRNQHRLEDSRGADGF